MGKSDHCVVTLLYNITFENCSYKVKRNIYDKGDYTAIKKHLSNIEWDIILSGKTVQQWDVLVDIIGSSEEQYIPSKMVEINRDDKFGEKLPNHIRLQIKNKHNMWKRYMETRRPDIYRQAWDWVLPLKTEICLSSGAAVSLLGGFGGMLPQEIFFNRYSLLQSGSIKIHMYCNRKNNNLTFLMKNTIYDISCKVHGRSISFHKATFC